MRLCYFVLFVAERAWLMRLCVLGVLGGRACAAIFLLFFLTIRHRRVLTERGLGAGLETLCAVTQTWRHRVTTVRALLMVDDGWACVCLCVRINVFAVLVGSLVGWCLSLCFLGD